MVKGNPQHSSPHIAERPDRDHGGRWSHIRSVSIGIWLKSGSRDEDNEWNGISHFIEHMVFKGTENRSAEAIARQVDSIGGNMDAFTAKRMYLLQHQDSR